MTPCLRVVRHSTIPPHILPWSPPDRGTAALARLHALLARLLRLDGHHVPRGEAQAQQLAHGAGNRHPLTVHTALEQWAPRRRSLEGGRFLRPSLPPWLRAERRTAEGRPTGSSLKHTAAGATRLQRRKQRLKAVRRKTACDSYNRRLRAHSSAAQRAFCDGQGERRAAVAQCPHALRTPAPVLLALRARAADTGCMDPVSA
jgi:hypothetical protein